MRCPGCSNTLPFYFALATEKSKKPCPSCRNILTPTNESIVKVQKTSVLLSFISGIPLGLVCGYLWFASSQPVLAVMVFIVGAIGVMGSAYIYTRSTMRFRPCLPES